MMNKKRNNIENKITPLFNILSIIFKRHFRERFISLCCFGSYTRGKIKDGSDIDFLLVIDKLPISYSKRIKIIFPIIEEFKKTQEYKKLDTLDIYIEPSFVIFTPEEIKNHPPLLLDIIKEGILIYDKNGFLKKELKKMGNKMKELKSVRKNLPDGSWYWVLKPDLKLGEKIEI